MGKRSNFKRVPRDFYPTPEAAVLPLLPHLGKRFPFVEPCAGDGQLVDILDRNGFRCMYNGDIEPQRTSIDVCDATSDHFPIGRSRFIFITNPPWNRKILHPIIENLSSQAPTWLLFDADWMHTKQAIPYLKWCAMIVSVGRVKWIPDSKMTGKDNCAWYLFKQNRTTTGTEFHGPTL